MIRENQPLLNRLQVAIDGIVIVISYVLAWYLRFKSGIFELDPWFLSLRAYMMALVFIVPGYLLLYYIFLKSFFNQARLFIPNILCIKRTIYVRTGCL